MMWAAQDEFQFTIQFKVVERNCTFPLTHALNVLAYNISEDIVLAFKACCLLHVFILYYFVDNRLKVATDCDELDMIKLKTLFIDRQLLKLQTYNKWILNTNTHFKFARVLYPSDGLKCYLVD